jgi:hypothetical protein
MKDEKPNDLSSNRAATPPPSANEGSTLPDGKLSPELLEWALQQINEEEIIAGLEEIQRTGGLQLSDFIQELELLVAAHD